MNSTEDTQARRRHLTFSTCASANKRKWLYRDEGEFSAQKRKERKVGTDEILLRPNFLFLPCVCSRGGLEVSRLFVSIKYLPQKTRREPVRPCGVQRHVRTDWRAVVRRWGRRGTCSRSVPPLRRNKGNLNAGFYFHGQRREKNPPGPPRPT